MKNLSLPLGICLIVVLIATFWTLFETRTGTALAGCNPFQWTANAHAGILTCIDGAEVGHVTIDSADSTHAGLLSAVDWSRFNTAVGAATTGATAFLGLSDTPNDYAGHAGDAVVVNKEGTAITFQPGGLLPALPSTGARDDKIAKFNGDTLGWEADTEPGVTAQELAAESVARASGDDIQASVVSTATALTTGLAAQASEDTPHIFFVSAAFTHSSTDYAAGDVLYVPPRSGAIERWFAVPQGGGDVTATQLAAETAARKAGDKWVAHDITGAAQLHTVLTSAANQKTARWIVMEDEVIDTYQGVQYDHKQGSVGYALPGETKFTYLFELTTTLFKRAGTSAELTAVLVEHVKSINDLFVLITADFQKDGESYKKWDLVYFAPKSITPKVELNIATKTPSIRIEPPSIAAPADLDGDYVLFLGKPDYGNAEVDELVIWVGEEGVHSVSSFQPQAGPFVIPFNVSTDEETQIGLTSSNDYIQVLAVYRKSGEYVGEDMAVLAVKNQVPVPSVAAIEANADRLALVAPFSDVQIEPPGIHDNNFPARLTFQFGDKQTDKTIQQVRVQIAGQAVHTSVGDVLSGWFIVAELSATERTGINNNITSSQSHTDVDLFIDYTDTTTARKRYRYPVNNSDFDDDPMVLQAAVNGANAAGAKTVTLPANYTEWDELFVSIWERGDSRSRVSSIPTALLAAQTTGLVIQEGSAIITWVKSARTITATGGGNTGNPAGDTIIYAVLR